MASPNGPLPLLGLGGPGMLSAPSEQRELHAEVQGAPGVS